ncbi:MAG: TldD/PmbA family protein [Candidatus Brockarchaeota archaeon]|nr:TldD/PmbA family protein [Candidatus Brockarchaeota archaeon]
MNDIVELSKKVLDYAIATGASYAEARFHSDSHSGVSLRNGGVEGVMAGYEVGMGIRVLVNGGLGFASTNTLKPETVTRVVDKAVKMARASSHIKTSRICFSEEEAYSVDWRVSEKKRLEDWSLSSKIDFLKTLDKTLISQGVNVSSRHIGYSERRTERVYANTEGALVSAVVPRPSFFALMTVTDPPKGIIQRTLQFGGSGGVEVVESWRLEEKLGAEVKTLHKMLTESVKAPEGVMDVVVGSEVAGIISHEASGHPGEADRILGREGAQAGESYLKAGDLNRKIGSEAVNVVDDPTIPGSYGFYLFDDEGVKARRKYLIKEGKICEFLLNRETAAKLGVKSNGSARASRYSVEPIVRMSNTFILPGDHSVEELLSGVAKGVYVKSFMEWNIDDKRWNQRYVGLEAYLIEDGRITTPVRNPVIEITTEKLFSSVDAVGKDLDFVAATCGKGDPMQGMPVYMGGPSLRMRNVMIRGVG